MKMEEEKWVVKELGQKIRVSVTSSDIAFNQQFSTTKKSQ
jgi:hypothetical protein